MRYPENEWNGGFAPRVGLAYAVSDKTVVRAGYGLFYTQAFYPGWGGGMSLDGFNPSIGFGDSLAGYDPAFYLDNGFPAYSRSENISASADDGHSPLYRPAYANHLSNTQQWNLTIEHKFGQKSFASVAYVASKGTHLPSQMQPLNVLNPSLLSMGSALNAVFAPGQQTLDGVSQPYAGWAQQLISAGGCAPSVAQALVAYPQFCGGLIGENENQGTSHYNSFQAKLGRNLSNGLYVEANYTYSHLTTDASSTTQATAEYGGIGACHQPVPRQPEHVDFPGRHSERRIYNGGLRRAIRQRQTVFEQRRRVGAHRGRLDAGDDHEVHLRHAVTISAIRLSAAFPRSSRRLAFRRSRGRCWRNRGGMSM